MKILITESQIELLIEKWWNDPRQLEWDKFISTSELDNLDTGTYTQNLIKEIKLITEVIRQKKLMGLITEAGEGNPIIFLRNLIKISKNAGEESIERIFGKDMADRLASQEIKTLDDLELKLGIRPDVPIGSEVTKISKTLVDDIVSSATQKILTDINLEWLAKDIMGDYFSMIGNPDMGNFMPKYFELDPKSPEFKNATNDLDKYFKIIYGDVENDVTKWFKRYSNEKSKNITTNKLGDRPPLPYAKYKADYLKNYGKEKYDALVKKFVSRQITGDEFRRSLEQGARFNLNRPVSSATTKFGVKFTNKEFDDIVQMVSGISSGYRSNIWGPYSTEILGKVSVKTPRGNEIMVLGYDYDWVDHMARRWGWNEDTIESWKNSGGIAPHGESDIYLNLNRIDLSNYEQMRDLVFHEIGHIKDPAIVKSTKLKKTYDSRGFPQDKRYTFHQFEITANATAIYNAITDLSNRWLKYGNMTKPEIIKQLKILRTGLTTGNITEALTNFIDDKGHGLFKRELEIFFANRKKFPKEFNKTIGRFVRHIDDIISDFSK